MPKWTPSQQDAIDARNRNILVSAAAGSGKTAVLVERVIGLITDEVNPVDIDKLLVVTFTKAAASEMKNRISVALGKLIKENINNTNAIKQMSLLPNANICTTDAFCMSLVREYFFKLDISQDFNVLDDGERAIVEDSALNEVVDSLYDEDKADFKALVELLSSAKNDNDFAESVKSIYEYIMSQPFPFVWLNSVAQMYDPTVPVDQTEYKKYVFDQIRYAVDCSLEIIEDSLSYLDGNDEAIPELVDVIKDDYVIFKAISEAVSGDWDNMYNVVNNISFTQMTRKKSEAKKYVADNRALYKNIFTKDILPYMSLNSEDYHSDCVALYPIFNQLFDIVKMYSDKMLEIKKEMNAYTFSDIEHFAIQLLFEYADGEIVRTDLAKEYEDTYYEILVDEYQDTNTAQDTLFKMLSNGHNQFMVGDVKQSIYRFRLAMPQIFTEKKNNFAPYLKESNYPDQKITLDKNFRSKKGICDYTNFVFSNLMTEKIGELDYNQSEYLNYGADYTNNDIPAAQIKIVDLPDDVNKQEYEAEQVAQLILNKIKSKELIKDGDVYRPVTYADFAILFRSTKKSMPAYTKVFNKYGIPVASSNKVNLFDNNEVAILMSLLRVVDNPMQDIPLLSTLMSVFYGYTPDELSHARIEYPRGNLYSSIVEDREHFSAFLDDLDRYRKYAASMNVESFLRLVISETSYMSVISAMGNSEQRKLNVLKLVDIAHSYDNGESVGLTAFVRYVDQIVKSKLNVESAEITHTGENSVLLMSVHKSKGLEFPICILADSAHQYNFTSLNEQVQLNDKYGIGLKVHNEDGLYRFKSLQYSIINDLNRTASISENLRVLYVAITRAKEQFISIASFANAENHISDLSQKLYKSSVLPLTIKHIKNDADLLLLTAMIHKDGKCLRDLCDKDIYAIFTDFDLNIEFLSFDESAERNDQESVPPNEELVADIAKKLEFSYQRSALSGFASKRAASSLDEEDKSFKYFASSKPAFLMDEGMTAAQKGTAMHAFMQYCDYHRAKENLEDEIVRLTDCGFISQDQADSLNRSKLNKLFGSDFGNRIFSSNHIYREIKVASFVPVNELEDTEYTDDVLVQGIADCVFEENGELVLVDYKTDMVNDQEELLDRYKNQISFYKNAVAKTLNMPVKEALLYSFWLDKCCIYK